MFAASRGAGMPVALDPGDRKLLLIAGAVMLAACGRDCVRDSFGRDGQRDRPFDLLGRLRRRSRGLFAFERPSPQRSAVGTPSHRTAGWFRQHGANTCEPHRNAERTRTESAAGVCAVGRANSVCGPNLASFFPTANIADNDESSKLTVFNATIAEQLHAWGFEN